MSLEDRVLELEKLVVKLVNFIHYVGMAGEHYSYGSFEDEREEMSEKAESYRYDLFRETKLLYEDKPS